jgi:hypothetical protein
VGSEGIDRRAQAQSCGHQLSLLELYRSEGDNLFNRIITGDETWIHHYEPQSRRHSMQWKHPSSPAAKKIQDSAISREVNADGVVGLSEGPVLENYQERGTTVTSARNSDMLRNELRLAIRTKRRGRLSKGVLFLHDNAGPYTAVHSRENLR